MYLARVHLETSLFSPLRAWLDVRTHLLRLERVPDADHDRPRSSCLRPLCSCSPDASLTTSTWVVV